MKKESSRKSRRFNAILWTATAIMWIIVTASRLRSPYVGEGLKVLSVLTLIVTVAACAVNWIRFRRCKPDNTQ